MKELRSKVGLVFQYPEHQLFEIDVLTDVCFGPKNLGCSKEEAEERAKKALRMVGMGEEYDKCSPFELSGGMQQRVGIAAAMLLRPGVLFADEPTAALDVSVQKQVLEELLLLRKTYGTSIVLVAHNIGVIGAMADRVLVMQDGRTVEYGETQTVLQNPQAGYTRTLLAAVPRLRRA